jgi:ribose-phosphate pyrophosphokinase
MSDISVDEVYIPYLPYARQDKLIANDTTFAKRTFLDMLSVYHYNYTSLDVHSNKYSNHKVKSYSPKRYIDKAILKSEATILVFPDKGAYERYNDDFSEFPVIVLDKVRDQSTGNITGMALNMELTSRQITFTNDNTPFKCLIIDDICDGGATFIGASTFLHEKFDCEVALYVTHGIFSKGFQKMFESGIIEFYTTKSLVMNIDGYELEEV